MLHIAPGDSAGGSLCEAVRASGRDDQVIRFCDDLSCGPIDSDDPLARLAWWEPIYREHLDPDRVTAFWGCLTPPPDRMVVWFSRRSAQEYAFFLALADRLGDHPYGIIDVTGLKLPATLQGGQPGLSRPMQAVSRMTADQLGSLLGTERPITAREAADNARCWRRLKADNAPFRIVTENGLVSAPADTFDGLLLEQATGEWRRLSHVIGNTMGQNMEPYIQTGDLMLLTRVLALVAAGRLVADGDPWNMRECRVRLPDQV